MADAPGTCHLIGCPDKGQHPPHGIGAPASFAAYDERRCLGFPRVAVHFDSAAAPLVAVCSVAGADAWRVDVPEPVDPPLMGALVDQHRTACPNRSAT